MLKRRRKDEYGKIDFAGNKGRKEISAKLVRLAIVAGIFAISAFLFVSYMLPSFKNAITSNTTTFQIGAREYDPSLKLKAKRDYSNSIAAISSNSKYVGDVFMNGNEILFGTVGASSTKSEITGLFIRDISTGTTTQVNATKQNTDILENKLNSKYIVYLDSNRTMGSIIKAINRSTGKVFTVKTCGASNPTLSLYDKYLVWTERTGTNKDKLFLYDLDTKENSTIYIFNGSEKYAFSSPDIYNKTIVFAASSKVDEKNGAIYSVYIGGNETEPYVYETDTYVHDPKTNGTGAVWIDTNGTTDSNLYYTANVRNNDEKPQLIASGVTQYGIGSTFIAYTKNSSIYLYFFDDQETLKLLPENEYGVLMSVQDNAITWLNTTVSTRSRDEIKYVIIK